MSRALRTVERPPATVWRITGLFAAIAILIAAPFLIWGEYFDARLSQDSLLGWFGGFRGTAWLVGIALLVSDLVLPIPNTMVMAALGVLYGPLVDGLFSTVGNCLSGRWDMPPAGALGGRSRAVC